MTAWVNIPTLMERVLGDDNCRLILDIIAKGEAIGVRVKSTFRLHQRLKHMLSEKDIRLALTSLSNAGLITAKHYSDTLLVKNPRMTELGWLTTSIPRPMWMTL